MVPHKEDRTYLWYQEWLKQVWIEQLIIVHFGVSIIKLSPTSEEDVAWCFFFAPASEKSLQSHSVILLR